MGNHDHSPAPHVFDCRTDFFLGIVIQRRGCLIQHDDWVILDQTSGQSNTLTLASGQHDTAFAGHRIIAFGKLHDIVVDTGSFAGFDHFLLGHVGLDNGKIVPDTHVEKIRHLADHADIPADAVLVQPRKINPVELNVSSVGLIEPGDQRKDRTLPAAAFPYECDGFAGPDLHIHTLQHRDKHFILMPVAVADIMHVDLSVYGIQPLFAPFFLRKVFAVEKLPDSLCRQQQGIGVFCGRRNGPGALESLPVVVVQNQGCGSCHSIFPHQQNEQREVKQIGPGDKLRSCEDISIGMVLDILRPLCALGNDFFCLCGKAVLAAEQLDIAAGFDHLGHNAVEIFSRASETAVIIVQFLCL